MNGTLPASKVTAAHLARTAYFPDHVHHTLANRVRAHLTSYGLATGLPTSSHYQADRYWRGPVWAPATVLLEDGLRRSGFDELADDVGGRLRVLCERFGFAENFDALTGAGLRGRAYIWCQWVPHPRRGL